MSSKKIGTRDEWIEARLKLLEAEKKLTKQGDEVTKQRLALPWVRVDKKYLFETDDGKASLADLFRGRSQLMIYHFMYGPDYKAGCPNCSAIADGFNGFVTHLANHDVTLSAVSRAPLEKLQAYKQRMGWIFPWASSRGNDFNYDFEVSFTEEQLRSGNIEHNYRKASVTSRRNEIKANEPATEFGTKIAASVGLDWDSYRQEAPGMSVFAIEDGVVYHTYSTYARGLDALWGIYQWLDRAPLGRNESGMWMRRHDEYKLEV